MLIVKNSIKNIGNKIEEFEDLIEITLPEELKDFLNKYNGGETPETQIKTPEISTDIRAFYGLGDVKYSYNWRDITEYDNKKMLPIAVDSFGNHFILSLVEPYNIYFVDHEKEKCIIEVAKSLKNFIKMCNSKKISEAAKRSPEERKEILLSKGKGDNISEGVVQMWKEEYEKYKNVHQEEVIV